jgi:hypothetical protein
MLIFNLLIHLYVKDCLLYHSQNAFFFRCQHRFVERSGDEECDRYYGLQISKSVLNQGAQKTDKSTEAYKLGTL